MKTSLILAALLAGSPALAHGVSKAEAKEHQNSPTSFDKQPPLGTWAKCPVSGDAFKVDGDTEFYTWQGRVYAFCCPDCRPDFIKNPSKYAATK